MLEVAQVHDVPAEILAVVPDHDYVDLFKAVVATGTGTDPERWARATVEGAPELGRLLAWRLACGLRPDHRVGNVGGWTIDGRGKNWIRLAAAGPVMRARMVFWIEGAHVSFATFVRYDRRIAFYIWWSVSHVHRAVAPRFLAGGVRRMERHAVSRGERRGSR
ncbi:MAG TPA: hypothetical protein VNB94_08640 [Mycobacteriales bacterium]|nr:hypothetical protein [Mycobacteriales bacterium]